MPLHIAGTRILPPISVPQPTIHPFIATMTPSPPELPPAVIRRLMGFIVRPKTLLFESSAASVCGTLVLAMMTQPKLKRRSTSVELDVAGLKHKDARPREESTPMILNESLTVIGSPCRGPIGFPLEDR